MQFCTFVTEGQNRAGVVHGGGLIDLSHGPSPISDIKEALRSGIDVHEAGRLAISAAGLERTGLGEIQFAPVIPQPGKIICLGLNYREHAREGGNEVPEYPAVFLRSASSLTGHNTSMVRPMVSGQLDFEAELAVVIGREGHHISKADALGHVFGYACFNDGSVRDYQRRSTQWTIGKNFDATGGFGPFIVTPDELPQGASGLRIECRLNGRVMQSSNTDLMLWDVAATIAMLSQAMTLEAGDVIVTGTPAGVGYARTPPIWMRDGDVIEIDIERVGTLVNIIRDEQR